MPQGNWHILHISHLLISILAHYHIITLIYGNYRYHHIGCFRLGRNHWLHERFCEAIGLIVGLLAAKALYASLAVKLCPTLTDSMTVAQVLAFVLIWLAVPLLFSLVASLLTRAMEAVSLGWLNHWLGAGLGALKYLLLTSLLIGVIEFIDGDNTLISKTKKKESVLYYPMEEFAGIFFPAAKAVTEQIVNGDFD